MTALLASSTRRRPVRLAAVCATAALVGALAAGEETSRLDQGPLPPGAARADCDVVGVVGGAPERGLDGERRLVLRDAGCGGSADWRIALRIAPSPDEPAAELDRLRAGDRVRVWARLRRPTPSPGARSRSDDPRLRLHAAGLDAVGRVKSARLVEWLAATRRPSIRRAIDRVRVASRAELDQMLGDGGARRAVAGAMLLGDREELSPASARRLRDAGLAHVTAISGLHVGLLAAAALSLLIRFRSRRILGLALLPALAAFVGLVGARASVLRAASAVAVALVGRSLGRDGDALNVLAALAAVLALARPSSLVDPGYALTFAATAGILLLARPLTRAVPAPAPLAGGLGVSAAAYLATAPVAAAAFGRLAPVGIVANLLAVPLCAVILGAGYAGLALGVLASPAGSACGIALGWAVGALLGCARLASASTFGGIAVAAPSWTLLALHLLSLAAIASQVRGRIRRAAWASLVVAVGVLHLGPRPSATPRLRIDVLDVGQGQAVLLRRHDRGALLVDAGGSASRRFDPGERVVVPALERLHVGRLSALVLTHGDIDHAGGAAAVLRSQEVGELWLPPGWPEVPRLRRLAALAVERGAALVLGERGVVRSVPGPRVEILAPGRRDGLRGNDGSLVLHAGRAPCRVLLPGDLERRGEAALLAAVSDLRAEALVVAHHGSRSATGAAFLRRVRPRLAIVSAGEGNPFGHPDPATVARLRDAGAALLRTDRDGEVPLRCESTGFRAPPLILRRRGESARR